MKPSHRVVILFGLVLAMLNTGASCSKKASDPDVKETAEQGDAPAPPVSTSKLTRFIPTLQDLSFKEDLEKPTKLPVTLLAGSEQSSDAGNRLAAAKGTKLSQGTTDTLLARLEPLKAEKGDQKDFAKRAASMPPPKKGDIVATAFPSPTELAPPDTSDQEAAQGPLKLLRYAPEGDVPVAPQISLTFNQPMVAVGSIADISKTEIPVTIEPNVKGSWRWVGAKTLLFEPEEERLPMATKYTVKLKDGITSKLGKTLAKDQKTSFEFRTPPVQVTQFWPDSYRTRPRDQPMFMAFDQRVDKDKILESIHIKGGLVFGARQPVLLTAEELDANKELQQLISQAEPDQWVAFKADTELPYDANISVTLKEGAPSLEGPLTTDTTQSHDFRTFGTLRVTDSRCGWGECSPSTPFQFQFSNHLAEDQNIEDLVTVEPSFPSMTVSHYNNNITIGGAKPGRRKYTVTLSKELMDEHNQALDGKNTYTFDVGAERPWISGTGGQMVVLDPSSSPAYTLFTMNIAEVSLKVYDVAPSDWGTYLEWVNDWNWRGKHAKLPPGKMIENKPVKIEGKPDEMQQTLIDLSKELGGDNLGHLVVEIRPIKASAGAKLEEEQYRPRIRKWIQATQIGMDAFADYEELLGMATSLKTGEPLSGITLTLANGGKATSDDTGVAKLELPTKNQSNNYLLATKGKDVALLPERLWNGSSTSWKNHTPGDTIQFFIFDDRGMYRPSEEVHVKGWARLQGQKKNGDIALPTGASALSYVVYDALNNKIGEGSAPVSTLGGFDFAFTLPDTPNLGNAYIQMNLSGAPAYGYTRHNFQIQEFRRPEFEASATAPQGPFFAGEDATIGVSANYYAGGALPGAETNWTVTKTQSSFTPPNQGKFTFGSWTPWWARTSSPFTPAETETFNGKTDVTGEHLLKLDFGMSTPPRPMSIRAQAVVMDVNRQTTTATTTLLVHPSQHYVGLRTEKYFVKKGEPLKVQGIVSDVDGNIIKDRPVKVRASRVKYAWKNGQYDETLVDPQNCEVMSEEKEFSCTFTTDVGGSYKITAITQDDYGRQNFTEFTRWVSGGDRPVSRNVTQEKVDLIPDQDTYKPGQKARILVQSPFVPAEGLLTLNRNGIVEERRFTMKESTTTLEVPIKSAHVPNLYVQVNLVGSAPRLNEDGKADESLPRRPAFASGLINLPVPPVERTLKVDVEPKASKVEPGASTSVSVHVKDADGKPVNNAEVAIVVVDESILALSSYVMADPVSLFYATRPLGVSSHYLRSFITLIDPSQLRKETGAQPPRPQMVPGSPSPKKSRSKRSAGSIGALGAAKAEAAPVMEESMAFAADAEGEMLDDAFGGGAKGGGGGGEAQTAIAVRSNFNPLAAFAPAVKTDAQGNATVDVNMPDNLTRYRIMAVAVAGDNHFGSGESNVTARLPLMIRPSAPRFLNFGDKFELPVVVQNQTDEPMKVQVATRATNVELISAQGYEVQVPANDRIEVRFPATTAMAGTARFQVAASAGTWGDASTFSLPVWTPATSEAFATYGVIDKGVMTQPVKTPEEVWPQFGQVEVSTSSTALQSLTDAFIYLYDYDYQCAEQISSRMLSVAALRDVLTAFNAKEMPSKADIEKSMTRDIEELFSRQNYDGGFGLWRKGQPSWPYVSLHAAHALTRAEQKGYTINASNKNRMLHYLKNIENYIPHYYTKKTRDHISAYALYVRSLNGDKDTIKARALIKGVKTLDDLTFESLGWLLGVLTGDPDSASELKELKRFIGNRVTETAGAAHFASSMSKDQGYLIMHSNRSADAIILEAMIDDEPKSDLIPKIVKGLLAHRKKGRWGNTQENAFVLLALDKYFNIYEKETPNFVARVWLGDVYAGDHKFKGRTTEQHQIEIPMSYLADTKTGNGEQPLIIQKDGKGRLYYRVGMTYAPKSLVLDPMDQGFVVERVYEPVDNDTDVKRLADGTWEIKAGAKVRIKLTMVAPTRRYHVALVDPLPAGLETLNPALATTEDVPQDPSMNTGGGWWWWSRPWFEHQNMRDERTEAFTTLLWGGVHKYTYYARATTPGEFVVPPAKAEEMYSPETFGRSGTDKVKIVD